MNKKDFLTYILSFLKTRLFRSEQRLYTKCALSRTCSFLYHKQSTVQLRECLYNVNTVEYVQCQKNRLYAILEAYHTSRFGIHKYTLKYCCDDYERIWWYDVGNRAYFFWGDTVEIRKRHERKPVADWITLEELFEPFYNQFK